MKITKAIDILELNLRVVGSLRLEEVYKAVALGVEALKIIDELQLAGDPISPGLLPGQTD